MNPATKIKVFVGMSGGVDSSVAAALLQDQDYHVVGVYFTPWKPENSRAFCDWEQDRRDAMQVAAKLGIEFCTWDLSKEYGTEVADYMIREYRAGRTPNPDILCNEKLKFGIFLKRALKEGADFIATGHYAQIEHNFESGIHHLKKATDQNKDQTYFLYRLNQEQLARSLFPIGHLTKPRVREIAAARDLITYNKKDSQGVCFVGMLDMKDFLTEYIEPRKGDVILDETREIIGTHDGVMYYTIGQRHGLDLKKDGGPYYVLSKDLTTNIITVTTKKTDLNQCEITAHDWHWIEHPRNDTPMTAKIRYRGEEIPVTIEKLSETVFKIYSRQPMHAPASGQSVVIYQENTVIGGGVIA